MKIARRTLCAGSLALLSAVAPQVLSRPALDPFRIERRRYRSWIKRGAMVKQTDG